MKPLMNHVNKVGKIQSKIRLAGVIDPISKPRIDLPVKKSVVIKGVDEHRSIKNVKNLVLRTKSRNCY